MIYHPIEKQAVGDALIRHDLTVWCGATFMYYLNYEYARLKNSNFTYASHSRKITDLLDFFNEHNIYGYVSSPFYDENNQGDMDWVDSGVFNKLVLNIRPKANNYHQLKKPLWSFEYSPRGAVTDDRPISPINLMHIPINIDASVTAEMLKNVYDYEIVAITDNFSIIETDVIADEQQFFSFKRILLYGEIHTKQTGDVL